MTFARDAGVRVVCPECGSPQVRKIRRVRRLVWLECKPCKRKWQEIHDDGIVHGLVVLVAGRRV